jgi:uncharacterized protein DUF397
VAVAFGSAMNARPGPGETNENPGNAPKGTRLSNEHDLARDDVGWFVSSFSNGKGSCVRIKFAAEATLVGDSKDTRATAPVVSIPSPGWNSFLRNIDDLA